MRLPSMPASVGPLGPGLAASLPTVCAHLCRVPCEGGLRGLGQGSMDRPTMCDPNRPAPM